MFIIAILAFIAMMVMGMVLGGSLGSASRAAALVQSPEGRPIAGLQHWTGLAPISPQSDDARHCVNLLFSRAGSPGKR